MRKYVFIIVCCIFVVVGVMFVVDIRNEGVPLSQKEKTAALTKLLGHTPVLEEKKTQDAWISHENQYVSFLYPESSIVYTKDNQSVMQEKGILDSFHFATGIPRLYATIQVINRPTMAVLSDFPSVLAREQQQSMYSRSQQVIDSQSAEVFVTDADPFENSAFFLLRGMVYSIVITGGSKEDVAQFFEKFIASFHARD